MTQLTRDDVKQIRAEIDAAMRAIGAKHGMAFTLGTIKFDSAQMRGTLTGRKTGSTTGSTASGATVVVTVPAAALNKFKALGIDPTKRYSIGGAVGAAKFVDYVPRRPKYPFVVERSDGKRFKVSDFSAQAAVKAGAL